MAEDPNKAQEEAKKKQEEQRRLQEEAKKTRESSARSAEQVNQQAIESLRPPKGVEPGKKVASGGNDLGKEATDANKAVGQVKGYSKTGAEKAIEENKAVAELDGVKANNRLSWSATSDPYATSLYNKSFKQATIEERQKGLRGEAEQARELLRAGQENLKKDAEYLRGALGLKPDMLGKQAGADQIIKSLEKQTGIKASEGTAGLGQYSDRDLAKYMSNPQVKSFVDNLKSGTQQVREIAPEAKPARPGEPGYQTDFQQRVAQYRETTKGNRLDTSRITPAQTTAQRVDPLQPMGGSIMGGVPKMGGGVYGPGGYGAENVPTNRPAKTQQELEQRMAKFEASKDQNIASSVARTAKPKGVYLPGGQFIANQPKTQSGMETDEQRIARREKELGVGRFASKPSYFDDKSRGRRII